MEFDSRPFSRTIEELQRVISFPLPAPTRRCHTCLSWLRRKNRLKVCDPCRTRRAGERWENQETKIHAGLLELFWTSVEQRDRDTCWVWLGKFDKHGAPALHYGLGQYRPRRIAFEVRHGAVPTGRYILTACGNAWCVNPEHMMIAEKVETPNGTRYDNGVRKKNGIPRN